MKDTYGIVLAVLGAVIIGGVGFFAGRHMNAGFGRNWGAGNSVSMNRSGFGRGGMMDGDDVGGRMGARRGQMGNSGEITKIDGTTVTLKYTDGTTKEVTLSAEAAVNTMTKGTLKDLKVGQTIMVTGGGFWSQGETVIVKP